MISTASPHWMILSMSSIEFSAFIEQYNVPFSRCVNIGSEWRICLNEFKADLSFIFITSGIMSRLSYPEAV
ncbi:MAG: hypothetical protein PHH86_05040, partial [Sphaerochaetaceae bacterium]|nr:hypothetical protein [Sphaerochaetaceae bacterium]